MNAKIIIIVIILLFILSILIYIMYRKILKKKQDNKGMNIKKIIENMKIIEDGKKYGLLNYNEKTIDIPIFYINLDRSQDRKEFMEKQFQLFNIKNVIRISGVDGSLISDLSKGDINDGSKLKFINNYKLNKGELGCTLSHIKAIKEFYNKNINLGLILEDDCAFYLLPYWGETLNNIIDKAPKDWGILQLFTFENRCQKFTGEFEKHNQKSPCWSTAVYVINRKGAEDVLNNAGYKDITLGKKIDNVLHPTSGIADRYIYECSKTYYYNIPLFLVGDLILGSTIHPSHEDGHINSTNKVIQLYTKFNIDDNYKYEKQIKFAKVLYDMDELLKKYNIPYHLLFGTLLGAYRENKFIDHDIDIDLGVFFDDFNINIIKGNNKFKFVRSNGKIENGYECTFNHIEYNINVDIFLVYKENDYYWVSSYYGLCDKAKDKRCRWKFPKYKISNINFISNEFNIPYPTEEHLISRYGVNWNVPISYSYIEGFNKGYTNGLIETDFDKNEIKTIIDNKNKNKNKIITDLYPRKIKEMKKPIIWMYWQSNNKTNKPPYLNLCLKTIQKNCANDFEIIILNDEIIPIISRTIHPNFKNIEPIAMRADYIRFCIIMEYGGVWLDSDTIVLDNINFMIDNLKNYNFLAFSHENDNDISISVFSGNKNNRICKYYKYILENDPEFNSWLYQKYNIKWASPTNKLSNYMKELKKLYPNEYITYNAPENIYPVHWKNSKEYFWNKGKLDKYILNYKIICLHNQMYSDYNKNLTEEHILNSDYRISKLLKYVIYYPF
jgi:GR25 family glycosyltransferase involved in LPS biosynthesis/mannosyltransferase OCH1-like enzyme